MLYFISGASGGTPKKRLTELPGEGRSAFSVDPPWRVAHLPVAWPLIGRVGDIDLRLAVDAAAIRLAWGFGLLYGGNAPTELSGTR